MPPAPHEYVGREAIAAFLRVGTTWRPGRRVRVVPTRANGQPAVGCYLEESPGGVARRAGLLVLTLAGPRIRGLTRFLDADAVGPFGLPAHVPPG